MCRWILGCLGCLVLVSPAFAKSPKGKVVLDQWDAAYLRGGKAGYVHTTTVEFARDDEKILRTTVDMNLTLKRFESIISLRMETGTEETADGKVTGVFMRQYLGKQLSLQVVGQVKGKELHLRLLGKNQMKWKAPWNDKVIGLYRQQNLFKERKVKPGDSFDFLSFEPSISLVVTARVKVKDFETVSLPGSKLKKRLLRVEVTPDEIKIPKGDRFDRVQLPTLYSWLSKDYTVARSQLEMPGLGNLILKRATKSVALARGKMANITDIGISQLVPLKRRIPNSLDLKKAVYRITIRGDKNAASAFAQDARQKIKNARGASFELHVRASRGPQGKKEGKVKDEYLGSSYFINCKDAKVKELARKAVGEEKDPWKKALRIERWVRRHMKVVNDEALATADHVARTLEGDCTEHAMLAAAMCRAVGVPSRTAVGLIYADTRRGPVMAFHMWTEVWVQGQWVAIDATLGRGFVGADHIKISDQSWHETRSQTPLLPFVRVVGKLSIDVVQASK
jgi:hypothetical protein